jgi:hypothetical protein
MSLMTEETKPRGPYAQALRQIDEFKALCESCATELEQVSQIRAGLMDSDSRRAEVQRQIQTTLAHVAQRLRGVQ